MTSLFKFAFFLVVLCVGPVWGRNGCRQCVGFQRITFGDFTDVLTATAFFRSSLGGCATGNQYDLLASVGNSCSSSNNCKNWEFKVEIWRYCGNGGNGSRAQGHHCIDKVCALYDTLSVSCTKSVDCNTKCYCDVCQC